MDVAGLQAFLDEHIPLTRAMSVRVQSVEATSVTLAAPLAPNRNHHGTVFGGSASAIATLAAWCCLHVRLSSVGMDAALVVRRATMEYLRPIQGDFTATATCDDGESWRGFVEALREAGSARMRVDVVLATGGEPLARLEGHFTARQP